MKQATTRKDLDRAAAIRAELEKSGLSRELEAVARGEEVEVSDGEDAIEIDETAADWTSMGPQEALSHKARAGLVDVEAIKQQRRARAEGQSNWQVERVALEALGGVTAKKRRTPEPSAFELGEEDEVPQTGRGGMEDVNGVVGSAVQDAEGVRIPLWQRLKADDGWIDIEDPTSVPPPPRLPNQIKKLPTVPPPPSGPVEIVAAPQVILPPPPPPARPPPPPSLTASEPPKTQQRQRSQTLARPVLSTVTDLEDTKVAEAQPLMAPTVVR